jgi:hypothetical protein
MEGNFQATLDSRLPDYAAHSKSGWIRYRKLQCDESLPYHMFTARGSEIRLQRMSLEDLEFSRLEV